MNGRLRTVAADDLAARIGRWAANLRVNDSRRARVRASIRDFLGCVIAGTRQSELRPALWLARGGGVPVWGLADSFDPAGAALVTGTAGALLQLHDVYLPGGLHPSSPVIAAAWSALHVIGNGNGNGTARDRDFVGAVAAGYEAANRFALACAPTQVQAGSAPTGTAGAMGAAVAAALLGEMDAEGIGRAVTNAALLMPLSPFVTMTTHGALAPLHAGLAARAGFEAARLARDASAGHAVLEGTARTPGLISMLRGDVAKAEPAEWDGATLDAIAWKFAPACFGSLTALEALLRLEPVPPGSVQRLTVRLPDRMLALVDSGPHEGHLYDRLMSLRWVLARALETRGFDVATAGAPSTVADALANRIDVVHELALDHAGTDLVAIVELQADGRLQRLDYRRGADAEPPTEGPRAWTRRLDTSALDAKLRRLMGDTAPFAATMELLGIA